MFKTKKQRRRLADVKRLVEVAELLNWAIALGVFKTPEDLEFIVMITRYNEEVNRVSNDIMKMSWLEVFFQRYDLIHHLMFLKTLNTIIYQWSIGNIQNGR